MNGTSPGPAAEAAVWERPWSLDEIRKNSQSWSLAADAGLLQFLQEFSQQTISRTHEIKKQVDGLIRETKATDCRLHNVFNDFLMLSNTQFIENRVYDEEVEEPVPKAETEKSEQEKTREQKEADLIPKVQEAVNFGLQVLDSAFEQLDIKAGNSDSEEEETNERGDLILEPKDLYIDRPLPYLIGSQLFMEQEDVGLGDLSSEEGSVDSDRGSVVDSEEEKDEEESEDDFGNQSGDDQKTRPTLSDEEEDDDGCESEKEEEEEEDGTDVERPRGLKKERPTSFADELAARIKGDKTGKTDDEPMTTSSGEAKTKKRVKEKKEVRKVPSDDEEDDIFKPPKLTDEDFSPFGSKGGLFSGGRGLFDDDESDLFAEAPKESEEVPSPTNGGSADMFGTSSVMSPKELQKPVGPTPAKTPHPPVPGGLFDDDDDNDDFFVASNSKPALTVKSATDLFDEEEEGDLFGEKAVPSPAAVSQATKEAGDRKEAAGKKVTQVATENLQSGSETASKKQKGLFSDEEDSEQDLFSSAQNLNKSKTTSFPTSKLTPKTPLSLFDDEDEEDNLFGTTPAKKQPSSLLKSTQEKAKPSETQKKKSTLLFSSDEEDQWHVTGPQPTPASDVSAKGDPVKTSSGQGPGAKALKKTSLFEEDDEEDLFVVTKDSQKKSQKTSLLFEEDADSGGSLFGSPSSSAPPASMEKERTLAAGPLLFSDEEEKAAPFGTAKSVDEKAESVGKTVGEAAVFKMPGKGEPAAASAPGPREDSDLFASMPPLEKEVKGRTKNVLSLFEEEEEEEEKIGESGSSKTPQKATAKPSDPSAHFQSTGVFQDEELLFSHKLQKDNDPDVDLFASPKKPASEPRMHLPPGGGLFGDEEDDDLFSSAKSRPPVPEKKAGMKKENLGSPPQSHIPSGSTHGDQREPGVPKLETSQDPPGPAPFKTKEPSSRIGKLQANLAINPAALLPGAAPKIPGAKPVFPGLSLPPSEPDKILSPEASSPGSSGVEPGVSFDHPAQADTLQSANKSRIRVGGKRRPQSRAARRLAAQESGAAGDVNGADGPLPPSAKEKSASAEVKPLLARDPSRKGSREKARATLPPLSEDAKPVSGRATGSSARSPGPAVEEDLFGSGDLFSEGTTSEGTASSARSPGPVVEEDLFGSSDLFAKGPASKPPGQVKAKEKSSESLAARPGKGDEKKAFLPVLDEPGSDDDLFLSVKQKSTKKAKPVPFLEDEDDIFTSQKAKKGSKLMGERDLASKPQDIFEDDIFATEAIKPSHKTREKEKVLDSNLFDDNIDIFADLTVKPKDKKSKKKVESKSIFDDDMDDIFSSSSQVKTSKPKGHSAQSAAETKSESKASSTFDDPLNVFGGQ
ncbi:WASH complex subunit 2C isoform X3 [Ornithorhynchus anatinus]|uniref:WASH complex subunit 2C isoform X3 n=1 Tax=Ornithorhynchus anatinus TaxID=9258 RepID=UPI0010A937F0|nr:WASH complex subunit 2C isoform X3 [Ornithorhynchus anatinus]